MDCWPMVIALFVSLTQTAVAQGTEKVAITQEQHDVFALLDRFDARDDSHLPFVKVATGWTHGTHDGPWQNTYRFGFLLQSNGREFVVRMVDGNRLRLANTPANTPEHSRRGFSPADLRSFARDHAELIRLRRQDRYVDDFYRRPHTPVSPETQGLFLARTCAHLGHAGELHELWDALPEEMRSVTSLSRTNRLAAFEFVADLDARLWMDRGDPTLSWHDLLARYEFLLENYAGTFWAERWSAQRDAVKAHLATVHADLPPDGLATASVEQLVAGLANACCPQESGGFGQWNVEPMDPGPAGLSAFDELARRGADIVPALIAHLDDEGITRSWFYCSRFGGWFEPRKLGDNVQRVLETIVGAEAENDPSFDLQAWHDDVKTVGLRNHLLAAVARPGAAGAKVARTLLARFPDALPAVLDLVAKSEGDCRWMLVAPAVHAVRAKAGPPPPDLLRLLEADAAGADDADRWHAAHWLLELGSAKGARALTARWTNQPTPTAEEIDVVLRSGDVAVWQDIEKHLATPSMRQELLMGLSRVPCRELTRGLPPDVAVRIGEILRRCLVPLLPDTTSAGDGIKVVLDERIVSLHSASVADLAATQLAACWPERYRFDPASTKSMRRRQLEALVADKAEPARTQTAATPKTTPGAPASAPTIAALVFAPTTSRWESELRKTLGGLVDHPVTAEALMAALIGSANKEPAQTICLHLERECGASGFTLTCSLEPAETDAKASRSDFHLRITVAGTELTSCGLGSGRLELSAFRDYHTEYLARMSRAFTCPSEHGVELTVRLRNAK